MQNAKTFKRLENSIEYLDILVSNKDGTIYKIKYDNTALYTIELLENVDLTFTTARNIIITSYEVLQADTTVDTFDITIGNAGVDYIYGTLIKKGEKIRCLASDPCIIVLNVIINE